MGPWLVTAAVNGLMAIVMGAFAAHGLRSVLDADALGWIDTGSRYQMWHALALLVVASLFVRLRPGRQRRALQAIAWAFLAGIVLFSLPAVSTCWPSPISGLLPGSRPLGASS